MSDVTVNDRTASTDYPVLSVLAERWSPRAFDVEGEVDDAVLNAAFEAARWSPSASNTQPWRFIVGHRGTQTFDRILDSLVEFNAGWAQHASVLVANIAEVTTEDGTPIPAAIYDLGQAVAHFSVQAHADGLHVHQMAGFSAESISEAFELAPNLVPFTVMAVGKIGDASSLNEVLEARERAPRVRRPLAETVLVAE